MGERGKALLSVLVLINFSPDCLPVERLGSVTLTSLNFSFQICKMEVTSGLWRGLNEMRFDRHLAVSNPTVSIQDYYSPDCPGRERS